MCEATVYLDEKVILQDVVTVQVLPGGVRLTSMLESPVFVPAAIREIDCANHRVLLTPLPHAKS